MNWTTELPTKPGYYYLCWDCGRLHGVGGNCWLMSTVQVAGHPNPGEPMIVCGHMECFRNPDPPFTAELLDGFKGTSYWCALPDPPPMPTECVNRLPKGDPCPSAT